MYFGLVILFATIDMLLELSEQSLCAFIEAAYVLRVIRSKCDESLLLDQTLDDLVNFKLLPLLIHQIKTI